MNGRRYNTIRRARHLGNQEVTIQYQMFAKDLKLGVKKSATRKNDIEYSMCYDFYLICLAYERDLQDAPGEA